MFQNKAFYTEVTNETGQNVYIPRLLEKQWSKLNILA